MPEKNKGEEKMEIDFTRKDLKLMDMMLNKELGDTRLEIRHTDNSDYKNCLKDREAEINSLIAKVGMAMNQSS